MSGSAISRRYAKALVELGADQKMVERYGDELGGVTAAISAQAPLRLLLESPTLPLQRKTAMLNDLAEALDLSPGMRNFLGLLLLKGRLRYLAQIEADYRQLADERSGILRARVMSATSLSDEQRHSIKAGLERQTGKKVELTVAQDVGLIGGLKVAIGGKVFDGSIRTQLKRIEDTLQKG